MSALGQKPTYALQQSMSALHPIATAKAKFRKRPCLLYPRKRTCAVQRLMSALGQKRTLLVSFDHFVGGDEHARRYCKTECFRRLEIDDSFVLGWHLHRKIGRL